MTAPLWTWPSLCRALALPEVPGPDVAGISIDTRSLEPGDLFVALQGDPGPRYNTSSPGGRDGHDFVPAAVAAGAAGVLVDHPVPEHCSQLQVANTLDGLWALAAASRARYQGLVVAVTGSSGKTTAKTYLQALLGAHASVGSFNNFWGVPVSLARMPADATAGVFEIGTNAPGEIAPLAQLVQPDVALLLNVAPAHLGNFSGLEAIRQEKLTIATGLPATGGVLVVPDDLDLSGVAARAERVLRFGQSADADVQVLAVVGEQVRYAVAGQELTVALPGGGLHRALSAAAALACVLAGGRDPLAAAPALAEVEPPPGRGRVRTVAGITLIDDSYNANPLSMRLALESLAGYRGRRVAVLGDMLELGTTEAALHAELAASCQDLDLVICVGPRMQVLAAALAGTPDLVVVSEPAVDQMSAAALMALLQPDDVVLVKGSNRVFWARHVVRDLLELLAKANQPS